MISVIVLHYKIDEEDDLYLNKTLKSFGENNYEIIIADEKIDHVTKKINSAIKKSKGDFVIIMGNDNPIEIGRLEDLCDNTCVTTAKINDNDLVIMTVTCFPRWVLEKIDYCDEAFKVYCFDEDILMKLKQNNIDIKCINSVKISHSVGGRTTDRLHWYNIINESDKNTFFNKWNIQLK